MRIEVENFRICRMQDSESKTEYMKYKNWFILNFRKLRILTLGFYSTARKTRKK